MKDRLHNESEAAEFLGLTPRFLRDKRQQGGGPEYIRISHRCVRYSSDALEKWLQERTFAATSEERNP